VSKEIVQEVLGPKAAKELWSTVYLPALPVTPQDFALGGVVPAILYMMRWGHRRGQGRFVRQHGMALAEGSKSIATVAGVASHLAEDTVHFSGFGGDVERPILGDLLLAFALENKKHAPGRDEQVQRAFPTHYFSSWIDLPEHVAHFRGVPEMIVALLARQEAGKTLARQGGKGHFAVGAGFDRNLLLSLFGAGTTVQGQADSLTSDTFVEETSVGVDQLLTVRLAQSLGEAPQKMRGESPEIPNQRPLAARAAETFHDDFNVFLRAYGPVAPRQSLLPMLESCLAVGLTGIYLSTAGMLLEWSKTCSVPAKNEGWNWPLFVDCSMSGDWDLRRLSEDYVDDLVRRLARVPVWFMCLRILDQRARWSLPKELPVSEPDPTARINYLGLLLREDATEAARDLKRDVGRDCERLAEALNDQPALQQILRNDSLHPAWRLAEALVLMIGEKQQFGRFRGHLDSCLMVNEASGIARKRRTTVRGALQDRRSIVLGNTALDYLVHRHLTKAKRGTPRAALSFADFLVILRERHGFCVDVEPPGMVVRADLLRRNREFLERRLRDLGLLVGVNDAESMKRLRPRFETKSE